MIVLSLYIAVVDDIGSYWFHCWGDRIRSQLIITVNCMLQFALYKSLLNNGLRLISSRGLGSFSSRRQTPKNDISLNMITSNLMVLWGPTLSYREVAIKYELILRLVLIQKHLLIQNCQLFDRLTSMIVEMPTMFSFFHLKDRMHNL